MENLSDSTRVVTDLLDRPIIVGEFVVFHNLIYQVLEVPIPRKGSTVGQVKIILLNKSATTKAVRKYSKDLCMLPKGEVLFWLLRK